MNLTLITADGAQFHAESESDDPVVLLMQIRDRAGFFKGGWVPAQEPALTGREAGPSCFVNIDQVVSVSFDG